MADELHWNQKLFDARHKKAQPKEHKDKPEKKTTAKKTTTTTKKK